MNEKTNDLDTIIAEVEKICHNLENDKLPINETLEQFKKGINLIQEAESQLKTISSKISTIINNNKKNNK